MNKSRCLNYALIPTISHEGHPPGQVDANSYSGLLARSPYCSPTSGRLFILALTPRLAFRDELACKRPLTEADIPLAELFSPPLTEADVAIAELFLPPLTEEAIPPALLD